MPASAASSSAARSAVCSSTITGICGTWRTSSSASASPSVPGGSISRSTSTMSWVWRLERCERLAPAS